MRNLDIMTYPEFLVEKERTLVQILLLHSLSIVSAVGFVEYRPKAVLIAEQFCRAQRWYLLEGFALPGLYRQHLEATQSQYL